MSSDIVIEEDNEVINFLSDFDSGTHNYDKSYDELDVPFTQEEILSSIKLLSTNKSSSVDNIIYEYFKETENLLIEPLTLLFNYILDKQTFPKSWSKGVVIPVFKKGDPCNPNNYRGITLVSCFGKLFTVCINQRLKKWTEKYDILTNAQFGFKTNHSTVDAIFLLKNFIDMHLNDKKKLFVCYVDLLKCFDYI